MGSLLSKQTSCDQPPKKIRTRTYSGGILTKSGSLFRSLSRKKDNNAVVKSATIHAVRTGDVSTAAAAETDPVTVSINAQSAPIQHAKPDTHSAIIDDEVIEQSASLADEAIAKATGDLLKVEDERTEAEGSAIDPTSYTLTPAVDDEPNRKQECAEELTTEIIEASVKEIEHAPPPVEMETFSETVDSGPNSAEPEPTELHTATEPASEDPHEDAQPVTPAEVVEARPELTEALVEPVHPVESEPNINSEMESQELIQETNQDTVLREIPDADLSKEPQHVHFEPSQEEVEHESEVLAEEALEASISKVAAEHPGDEEKEVEAVNTSGQEQIQEDVEVASRILSEETLEASIAHVAETLQKEIKEEVFPEQSDDTKDPADDNIGVNPILAAVVSSEPMEEYLETAELQGERWAEEPSGDLQNEPADHVDPPSDTQELESAVEHEQNQEVEAYEEEQREGGSDVDEPQHKADQQGPEEGADLEEVLASNKEALPMEVVAVIEPSENSEAGETESDKIAQEPHEVSANTQNVQVVYLAEDASPNKPSPSQDLEAVQCEADAESELALNEEVTKSEYGALHEEVVGVANGVEEGKLPGAPRNGDVADGPSSDIDEQDDKLPAAGADDEILALKQQKHEQEIQLTENGEEIASQ